MHKNNIPVAGELPSSVVKAITDLGRFWVRYQGRPRPTKNVLRHWKKLVLDWANDNSSPLYVRKESLGRGRIISHHSGRPLVPTDNSPAEWAFAIACKGDMPSLRRIAKMIRRDQIPIAVALSKEEKRKAKYKCLLKQLQGNNPNSAGWKVGHIDEVGLKARKNPDAFDIAVLKEHFIRLMTPSNMFVVPKTHAGLAELPEFIHQMR